MSECSITSKSQGVGGWVAHEILLSVPCILYSLFYSQVPGPSRLTIFKTVCTYKVIIFRPQENKEGYLGYLLVSRVAGLFRYLLVSRMACLRYILVSMAGCSWSNLISKGMDISVDSRDAIATKNDNTKIDNTIPNIYLGEPGITLLLRRSRITCQRLKVINAKFVQKASSRSFCFSLFHPNDVKLLQK